MLRRSRGVAAAARPPARRRDRARPGAGGAGRVGRVQRPLRRLVGSRVSRWSSARPVSRYLWTGLTGPSPDWVDERSSGRGHRSMRTTATPESTSQRRRSENSDAARLSSASETCRRLGRAPRRRTLRACAASCRGTSGCRRWRAAFRRSRRRAGRPPRRC